MAGDQLRELLRDSCSLAARGSAPAIRTARSLVPPWALTAGRDTRESRSIGLAASSAHGRAYCIAMRFGASSPSTSVTKVSIRVITATATATAAPPRKENTGASGSASDRGRGRGEEPGQRDADLTGGKEAVRILGEAHEQPCTRPVLPFRVPQLTLAQRDQGDLTAREHRVEQHQHSDQQQGDPVSAHCNHLASPSSKFVRLTVLSIWQCAGSCAARWTGEVGMRAAGTASWSISIDQWDHQLEWALWFRAAERIEVPAGGLVTGPPDVDPLPEQSVISGDELAEGWLWWWRSLLA
jgi:hypothetical protein